MNKTQIEKNSKFQDAVDHFTLPNGYFILKLGIELQYEYAPKNVKFCAPYEKMGNTLFESFEAELYSTLCNPENKKPNTWVLEWCVNGDTKELLLNITELLLASYNVGIGIAVYVSVLIVKKGLLEFCNKKSFHKPKHTVTQLLKEKQRQFEKKPKRAKLIKAQQ